MKSIGTLDAPDSRDLVPAGTPVGALPELMQDAWVAFARTGSPRARDLPGWEPYTAARRTNELGVRVALGATRGSVVQLVLRGAFALILLGLLIGLPLAFAAGRFLGDQLHGANPYDPVVILTAVLTLGMSALIASLVPALRASSISPLDALRAE